VILLLLEGNSANQAIELLIQKGVPEAHIIFLNLISVSVKSYISIFRSFVNVEAKDLIMYLLLYLFASLFPSSWPCFLTGAGGNPLCLQTFSSIENCDVWNRPMSEPRIQSYTGLRRVWRSLLRHRRGRPV